MVGRDIGTVVMPDADLKLYLDASAEERARRRFAERQARGEGATFNEVLAVLRERDRIDTGRTSAPLRCAPDAVRVVTDGLGIQEVLDQVMDVLNERDS